VLLNARLIYCHSPRAHKGITFCDVHLHSLGVACVPRWTTCYGKLDSSFLFVRGDASVRLCDWSGVGFRSTNFCFTRLCLHFRILCSITLLFFVWSFYNRKIIEMIISHFSSTGWERTRIASGDEILCSSRRPNFTIISESVHCCSDAFQWCYVPNAP